MPKKLNLNKLAADVALAEGGAQSVSIGQVKEIVRKTFLALRDYPPSQVLAAIENQR